MKEKNNSLSIKKRLGCWHVNYAPDTPSGTHSVVLPHV